MKKTMALRPAPVALLVALALFSAVAGAAERPVVVELFTSQGCSSCPPADRVLGELGQRDDVLPLSFHVTYWDRLGWPDVFGLEAATDRQYAYAAALERDRVYTPQMVIDGRVELVGSRRGAVLEIVELLKERRPVGPPLVVSDHRVDIGAGQESGILWLAAFDTRHEVRIERGENAGRTLAYHNVVRALHPLARWTGEPLSVPLPLAELRRAGHDGAALILQARGSGPILNAVRLELEAGT